MEERTVIPATMSVFLSGMLDFLAPLRWFAVLGLVLIVADLRFGISAARYRGEKVRFSRAGRRSMNKMVDYACWIFLSAAIDKAIVPHFDMPTLPALVLVFIYGFEIESCIRNYCESRGKKINFNFFAIFKEKMKFIDIKEDDNNLNDKKDE